jgi:hypothetical protein
MVVKIEVGDMLNVFEEEMIDQLLPLSVPALARHP